MNAVGNPKVDKGQGPQGKEAKGVQVKDLKGRRIKPSQPQLLERLQSDDIHPNAEKSVPLDVDISEEINGDEPALHITQELIRPAEEEAPVREPSEDVVAEDLTEEQTRDSPHDPAFTRVATNAKPSKSLSYSDNSTPGGSKESAGLSQSELFDSEELEPEEEESLGGVTDQSADTKHFDSSEVVQEDMNASYNGASEDFHGDSQKLNNSAAGMVDPEEESSSKLNNSETVLLDPEDRKALDAGVDAAGSRIVFYKMRCDKLETEIKYLRETVQEYESSSAENTVQTFVKDDDDLSPNNSRSSTAADKQGTNVYETAVTESTSAPVLDDTHRTDRTPSRGLSNSNISDVLPGGDRVSPGSRLSLPTGEEEEDGTLSHFRSARAQQLSNICTPAARSFSHEASSTPADTHGEVGGSISKTIDKDTLLEDIVLPWGVLGSSKQSLQCKPVKNKLSNVNGEVANQKSKAELKKHIIRIEPKDIPRRQGPQKDLRQHPEPEDPKELAKPVPKELAKPGTAQRQPPTARELKDARHLEWFKKLNELMMPIPSNPTVSTHQKKEAAAHARKYIQKKHDLLDRYQVQKPKPFLPLIDPDRKPKPFKVSKVAQGTLKLPELNGPQSGNSEALPKARPRAWLDVKPSPGAKLVDQQQQNRRRRQRNWQQGPWLGGAH